MMVTRALMVPPLLSRGTAPLWFRQGHRCRPENLIRRAGAPHDVVESDGAGAPYDVVRGGSTPHDVVVVSRAPHDVVVVGGAPHDVVRGGRAPDDVVVVVGGAPHAAAARRAPEHAAAVASAAV